MLLFNNMPKYILRVSLPLMQLHFKGIKVILTSLAD